ncbi:MAG: GNAT family N-acetyltransferase [Lachnospiraceae bacterium]|nr:GNAT family N-acetyltransferase [Lachnospiraceae bacterium]
MEIVRVKTKKQKKDYLDFLYKIYENDKNYCDMNVIFVRNFLYKKDSYAKRHKILPIIIYDNKEPKLECIFVIDETSEIKLAFVEFLPKAEKYLKKIIDISNKLMSKYEKSKTIVGINGQISYGLGILTSEYNQKFEFNSNYNKDYYTNEMDKVFPVMKRAFSYKYDVNNSVKFFDNNLLDKNYREYQFRFFEKKRFKEEMLIFGRLCHESLKQTPYYSEKTPYEMYELMRQTKLFFKDEDIIFAMKDGKEVGFIYTHPDYAELFNNGRLNYITFLTKLLTTKPKRIIYNVIGVLPDYQRSGLAMNLIDFSLKLRRKDFTYGSSSFILEDNKESTSLCRKMATGINKEFHLYEILRRNDV